MRNVFPGKKKDNGSSLLDISWMFWWQCHPKKVLTNGDGMGLYTCVQYVYIYMILWYIIYVYYIIIHIWIIYIYIYMYKVYKDILYITLMCIYIYIYIDTYIYIYTSYVVFSHCRHRSKTRHARPSVVKLLRGISLNWEDLPEHLDSLQGELRLGCFYGFLMGSWGSTPLGN